MSVWKDVDVFLCEIIRDVLGMSYCSAIRRCGIISDFKCNFRMKRHVCECIIDYVIFELLGSVRQRVASLLKQTK